MYLYLMLEFQSTVDPMMAVRVQVYSGLLWQQLVDSKQVKPHALPLIVPIILYNGNKKWTAKVNVCEMIAAGFPRILLPYVPSVQYLYLCETTMLISDTLSDRNLASLIFRLEQCPSIEALLELLCTVEEWFADPERQGLDHDFGTWIDSSVLKKFSIPEKTLEHQGSLRKVSGMLAENIDTWRASLIAEGRTEGWAEGIIKNIFRNVRRQRISADEARADIIELRDEGELPEPLATAALKQLD